MHCVHPFSMIETKLPVISIKRPLGFNQKTGVNSAVVSDTTTQSSPPIYVGFKLTSL